MRASTARLTNSPVRLADLEFPQVNRLIHRTRLAFIHLDNLLGFAKRDRDGRVDGYLCAHLPDECLLLYFRKGEAVNASSLHMTGREVITINEALARMRDEADRGDVTYCAAPLEQLAWMYQSCAVPLTERLVDAKQPAAFLPALRHEHVSGVLEFISNGRVNYLLLEDGRLTAGYLCAKPATQNVDQYIASLFEPGPNGAAPALAAMLLPPVSDLPAQAPQALIQTYRELYWRLLDGVEREFPSESRRRAQRASASITAPSPVLMLLGVPRGQDLPDAVVRPEELPAALAAFATQLLESAEVVMPGAASAILRDATREHRYVLQAAGFYDRLPWPVTW
jgi:hypothetical protein